MSASASESGSERPRVVVVTGGSLGIGKEIARAFCEAEDHVILTARGCEALEAAAAELEAEPGSVEAIAADVSSPESVQSLVEAVETRCGRIDVLVNNAGIYGPIGPFVENTLEAWCETVEINLLGVIRMTRSVLPGMLAAGDGVIVNLSGGGATGPKPGYSAYAATKTAVVRFTEVLAHELAETSIRCNAIAPGFVATRLHDQTLAAGDAAPDRDKVEETLGSGGDDPRRAAQLAVFLASPGAARINGRLISAIWDDWEALDESDSLESTDLFTLRRIDDMFYREVPRE